MAAHPPSYDEAVSRDPWPKILGYLDRRSLCITSQVCKKWYETSVGYLWSDPAANFESDDGAISGLVNFLGSLSRASLEVRQLTQSLSFPWAHVEAYGGIEDDWLRKALDLLPNLKLLNVKRLSFFEHTALIKLRYAENPRAASLQPRTFGLRYLNAEGCVYLSAESLYQAIPLFPRLVYLNLSSVYPAVELPGSISPLRALKHLPNLRVLKLCRTGMRDVHVEVLADTLQHSLKYLDVRENYLTDKACETLSNRFLHVPDSQIDPPPWLFDPEYKVFEESDENLDTKLERLLTSSNFDITVLDQVATPTLSHLQLSGNTHLTPSFLVSMLHKSELTSLDADIPHIPSTIHFDPTTLATEDTKLRYLRIPWSFLQVSSDMFNNLHALRVLVLTNIPATARDSSVVSVLSELLTFAGRYASTQRENIRTSNALPPGRRTLAGLKAQTLVQFPLRKIVLEVVTRSHFSGSASRSTSIENRGKPSLSPTGDADTETFYAASKDDFSFFKDDPEENGSSSTSSKQSSKPPEEKRPKSQPLRSILKGVTINTIEQIATMRKRQRAEYQAREARFIFSDAVDEEWKPADYWDGDVVVMRK